jgi:uncharacterized protein (TIGR02300 family)
MASSSSSSLGTKRHCQSCGKNYYDLNKTPITCPDCQAKFDPEVFLKSRRTKPVATTKKVESAEPIAAASSGLDDDIEGIDAPISKENLEDDSDLAAIASGNINEDDADGVTTEVAIESELDIPNQPEDD